MFKFSSRSASHQSSDSLKSFLKSFNECDLDVGIIAAKNMAALVNQHQASPDDADILLFLQWAIQNYQGIHNSGKFHLIDHLLYQLVSMRLKGVILSSNAIFAWYFKNPLNSSLDKICIDYVKNLFECSPLRDIISEAQALLPQSSIEIEVELGKLGEGGFAKVTSYICIRDGKQENIAIKYPKTKNQSKFIRELWIHSLLSPHPNIIDCYGGIFEEDEDEDEIDGIALKLADFTLFDLLFKQSDRITFSNVQRITFLIEIANAMIYMHALGIVYGDLKLENILMKKQGEQWVPYLTDFGLSAFVGEQAEQLGGSYSYVAPEILEAIQERYHILCSTAVDIYAFAIIICEVMSLKIAWHHIEKSTLEKAVKKAVLAGRRPLTNELSLSMQKIVVAAWSQDPRERTPLSLVSCSLQKELYKLNLPSSDQLKTDICELLEDSNFTVAMNIMGNLRRNIKLNRDVISGTIDVLSLLTWAYQHFKELKRIQYNFLCVSEILDHLLNVPTIAKEVLCIKNAALLKPWCFDNVNASTIKTRFLESIQEEVKEKMINASFSQSYAKLHEVFIDFSPRVDIGKMKQKKILGRGTFAKVVRYENKGWNNNQTSQVAFKIYNQNQMPIALLREVFFHNTVKHKNIVTFLGLYTEKRGFFTSIPTYKILGMAFELANYGLYELMGKKDPLIEKEVTRLAILMDIANALCYLHELGIVHRDIKPENILIFITENSLTAKLTDFGLAAYADELVFSAGTLGYDPPEYASASGGKFTCSVSSDCYAFGVLSYEVISMRSPWPHLDLMAELDWDGTREQRKQDHLNNCQPDMRGLSENITSMVTNSLNKSPSLRPTMFAIHEWLREERAAKTSRSSSTVQDLKCG